MDNVAFDQLFAALTKQQLSFEEAAELRGWLAGIDQGTQCLAIIEETARGRPCPHCGGARLHRCGHASSLQRYRCLGCRRSHNALTGTPLARLRKREHWLAYLQCALDACTIRAAARRVGVHRTTSFRWRHRFVPAASRQRPPVLGGIVEADETYLLESQKGSRDMQRPARKRGGVARWRGINGTHDCVLVARDRTGCALDFYAGCGPLTTARLAACLGKVLAPDAMLFTDGATAYRQFAKRAGIAHAWVNASAGEHVRGDVHLQNVKGWHAGFKGWLLRFCGVASRYLEHYSGWWRVLDEHRLTSPPALLVVAAQRCAAQRH